MTPVSLVLFQNFIKIIRGFRVKDCRVTKLFYELINANIVIREDVNLETCK